MKLRTEAKDVLVEEPDEGDDHVEARSSWDYFSRHRKCRKIEIQETDMGYRGVILPQDLIVHNILLPRVPFLGLIRARCVCKRWRDAIFSPAWQYSLLANATCWHLWLLVANSSSQSCKFSAFHSESKRWYVVPAPFSGQLVAASGGLFCFMTNTSNPPSLVVGNPITKQWKHLPTIPLSITAHGPRLIVMSTDTTAGSYKVVALFGVWDDDASDAYCPFLYNTVDGHWIARKMVSASLIFMSYRTIVEPPDTVVSVDSKSFNILLYNIIEDASNLLQLKFREPCNTIDDDHSMDAYLWQDLPHIAACNGCRFRVDRCSIQRPFAVRANQSEFVLYSSVGIWIMQQDKHFEWDFVSTMPAYMMEQMLRKSDHTGLMVASDGTSQVFIMLAGSAHMVAFDVCTMTWNLLPGCPSDGSDHHLTFFESMLWIRAV